MVMQAVILSGGLGTRLRSVDETVPKPMVKVAGQPFLHYLTKMLRRRGISEMLFLLAYKSEVVVRYIEGLGRSSDLRADYSVEPSPMGTGGALRHASGKLADAFFVINGDSYLDMDYNDLGGRFMASGLDAMMTVYDNSEKTDVICNVAAGGDGLITDYRKGAPEARLGYVDAGVLAMKRNVVVDLIPPGRVCSLEHEIYGKLISGRRFGSYVTSHRFYDIGTPERLREFEKAVRQ
jgi:NDP-sugar pyrophosphorylase family protein